MATKNKVEDQNIPEGSSSEGSEGVEFESHRYYDPVEIAEMEFDNKYEAKPLTKPIYDVQMIVKKNKPGGLETAGMDMEILVDFNARDDGDLKSKIEAVKQACG